MILAWPLLIIVAGILVWRHRGGAGGRADAGGQGVSWFLAWLMAGFLMSFSFVTGLSIGLVILPLAAAVLIWVARRSPRLPEASGFLVGIAATAAIVVFLSP